MTTSGRLLDYGVLLLAVGADAVPAFDRGLTFDPRHPQALGWLLRDIEQGHARRVAVIVPPGRHWALPAYELALLIAGHASRMRQDDFEATLVVPEPAPLAVFGQAVSDAVRVELQDAGVRIEVGRFAEVVPGGPSTVVLHPGPRRLDVDRVVALPRLDPRPVHGISADATSFLQVDAYGRLNRSPDVYAIGDATNYPIKHGDLAAQQADVAAAHIAARAGADVEPAPFRPVLRGRMITGHGDLWLYHDPDDECGGLVARRPLWWSLGKLAARYLAPALALHEAGLAGSPADDDSELMTGSKR
jgi:sulfide:quinone oxidoreductase